MSQPARQTEYKQNYLETGQVVDESRDCFGVDTQFGPVRAGQAASCLVKPQSGDTVLLFLDSNGSAFILSVLTKAAENAQTNLVFDEQVNLRVRGAGLTITTDRDISLAAEGELAGTSSSVSLHAEKGRAAIEELSFFGRLFNGRFKKLNLIAETVDHIFDRLTQRLKNNTRYVEDQEEVQTGTSRYLVEDLLTVQTKNTLHQAEEIITLNGEQIHLG